jgi:NAD(P)-dependent dehydrogenase (short-subunit alcohol dehydrogenase family)
MSLKGKAILITGAAGGLGSALALTCAELGAELVLLDKDRRGLGVLSDTIVSQGWASPGLYPMDLAGAGLDDFTDLADTIQSEYGGLDALVHCALEFDSLQPLEQIQPQEWLKSMQVNVNAPWLLSCSVLPLLRKAEIGKLVFLLDDPDKVCGAYWGAYGTGKVALSGMVKQFSDTLSHTSVSVHGIIPGPMRTSFRSKVYHAENPLDQPDPMIVAQKIAMILSGQSSDIDLIADFAAVST